MRINILSAVVVFTTFSVNAENIECTTESGTICNDGSIFVGEFLPDGGDSSWFLFAAPGDLGSSPYTRPALKTTDAMRRGYFTWKDTDDPTAIDQCHRLFEDQIVTPACFEGQALSQQLIADESGTHFPAEACENLSVGGHEDWYLPSRDEMMYVYDQLIDGAGQDFGFYGQNPDDERSMPHNMFNLYLTSSSLYGDAWAVNALNGTTALQRIGSERIVRCVRRAPSGPDIQDIGDPGGGQALEGRAIDFVARNNTDWSLGNREAMRRITAQYAAEVEFYGNAWTREQVLAEKRAFADRWPLREYYLDLESAEASCDSGICVVNGVVSWYARSPARIATSRGTAAVEITLERRGGDFLIVAEDGEVLDRQ